MNFALILCILAGLTGCITLLDQVYLKKKRTPQHQTPAWIEQARSFFPVFLAVIVFRTLILEPFRIPSGSLMPTLQVGDFVAVNKFIYGLRWPVLDTLIMNVSHPQRGDIVVFRWPPDPSLDYIKRVIGLPGDHVSYHQKTLSINGIPMPLTFVDHEIDASSNRPVLRYVENLNGLNHDIYLRSEAPAIDFEITVPEHSYFVMGDNRDDSADSRYWGVVSETYLRGKAFLIWMSFNTQHMMPRFNRIGTFIH